MSSITFPGFCVKSSPGARGTEPEAQPAPGRRTTEIRPEWPQSARFASGRGKTTPEGHKAPEMRPVGQQGHVGAGPEPKTHEAASKPPNAACARPSSRPAPMPNRTPCCTPRPPTPTSSPSAASGERRRKCRQPRSGTPRPERTLPPAHRPPARRQRPTHRPAITLRPVWDQRPRSPRAHRRRVGTLPPRAAPGRVRPRNPATRRPP